VVRENHPDRACHDEKDVSKVRGCLVGATGQKSPSQVIEDTPIAELFQIGAAFERQLTRVATGGIDP
jgi:hypothetical protein